MSWLNDKEWLNYVHVKVSKDSCLCGCSIFGVLTNAEGRKVDCPKCLERQKKKSKPKVEVIQIDKFDPNKFL